MRHSGLALAALYEVEEKPQHSIESTSGLLLGKKRDGVFKGS